MNSSRVSGGRLCRGFTLLELVVSVAVASVLVVGLSASVVLAMRAGDSSVGPFSSSHSGAQAVLDLTRDLQDAISVNDTSCTAKSVAFTVPDRTGDGIDETISYSWSGTSGDPLLRTMNGGTAEMIAANITSLEFTHLTRTVTSPAVRSETDRQCTASPRLQSPPAWASEPSSCPQTVSVRIVYRYFRPIGATQPCRSLHLPLREFVARKKKDGYR